MKESIDTSLEAHAAFDLHTWQLIDDPRYFFTRTSEFFPHAVIHRDGGISLLESSPRPEVGAASVSTSGRVLPLDDFLHAAAADGIVVAHRGRLVYERYPRMRAFEKHILWSVSKTFPSTLIAMLEDETRIDVQEPVERYLFELAESAWRGTPVIDILDMASGMGGLESDDPGAYSDPETLFYGYESSLGMLRPVPTATRSTYDFVAALPRLKPSSENFEYTSVNTFVLGWIIERIEGRPFAEVVANRIWRRIGAESDAQIIMSKHGAAATHGGISAVLRDVVRWGLLFTPSWSTVANEPLISAAYLQKVQHRGNSERYRRKLSAEEIRTTPEIDLPRHNTYQWDRVWSDGDFFKAGFRGQGLYVSPARDLVIAYVGTRDPGCYPCVRSLARSGLFA